MIIAVQLRKTKYINRLFQSLTKDWKEKRKLPLITLLRLVKRLLISDNVPFETKRI